MSGAEWHGSRRAKSTSGRHEAQLDGACADRARPTSRAVCQAADVRRRMPGLLRICCRPLYRCRPTVQRCRPTIQRCRPTANKVQYVECTAVQCTPRVVPGIFGCWFPVRWCGICGFGVACPVCVALRWVPVVCPAWNSALPCELRVRFVCVFRSG